MKSNSSKPTPEICVKQIIVQMRDDGFEFFVNSKNEPTIKFPNDPYQKEWPADSQRVNDYLHSVYFELNGLFLKSPERDFLMAQLREDCRTGGLRMSEVESVETEQDPIVQAVICLMNRHDKIDSLTAHLLAKLRKIQSEGWISAKEDLTPFVNVFSRQLRRLIPTLKGFGLSISLEHKEDGSHCKIERLADFQSEPTDGFTPVSSDESSGVSSGGGESLPKADDADGTYRADKRRSDENESGQNSTEKGGDK